MSSPGSKIKEDVSPGTPPLVTAELLTVSVGAKKLLSDLSFVIGRGEHWALTGAAGIGKSTLGKALCGQLFVRGDLRIAYDSGSKAHPSAVFVDQWFHFTDQTGLSSNFYYQQRYNSQDAENAVTVARELEQVAAQVASRQGQGPEGISRQGGETSRAIPMLLKALNLEHRRDASLVQLSSGEHKKLQLIRAFLFKPQLLVLDNPYIGLDAATCATLDGLFADLAADGTQLVIIGESANGLPPVVTHVARLRSDGLTVVPRDAYQLLHSPVSEVPGTEPPLPVYTEGGSEEAASAKGAGNGEASAKGGSVDTAFTDFIRMENVRVQYEQKVVLDKINWTVRKGERWWLKGHNGAGKSTLLSLVVGDNPQAYANKIYLFDKRRGSGESIWDIKRKIGYISPELHWYFDQQTTCADAIATGFFDTTGLYRTISPEQEAIVAEWLNVFDLEAQSHKRIQDLSIGNQRMTLLARALVKNPPVLILDEPCQGLDDFHAARFVRVVDRIMEHPGRTLLYVSHRTDQLPACIDHLLSLAEGRQITNEPYNHLNRTSIQNSSSLL
jgi:molybdate transport system ATP-binding protein